MQVHGSGTGVESVSKCPRSTRRPRRTISTPSITTQVPDNGAYDLSCVKQALDAEDAHRAYGPLVLTSMLLTLSCAFVERRHRAMFQQNPRKGCQTMFAFAGLKVALGILLIGSWPWCSPGCGKYLEMCAHKGFPIFCSFVVFLIALRWIYLGVMFYRKMRAGPLVVALPLAHVVVCDEDEESPQAPTLATWQSTAVWVTLLVLLLLGVSPKHFFYYCVPNGLGELAVYFVVLFWALMVALLCRPTSDARRPATGAGHARRPRNPLVKPSSLSDPRRRRRDIYKYPAVTP